MHLLLIFYVLNGMQYLVGTYLRGKVFATGLPISCGAAPYTTCIAEPFCCVSPFLHIVCNVGLFPKAMHRLFNRVQAVLFTVSLCCRVFETARTRPYMITPSVGIFQN
ncbi:hypothetical protein JB92DRAFT_2971657 [Gautieria morchelliformis]|nr:hypothetical protein JB92DRAFT_2971657 [Gautieria morchelliformis]